MFVYSTKDHSSSQQRLDQRFYVLTLNFEIPQVAYFQFLIDFYEKIAIFYSFISWNFSVRMLGYFFLIEFIFSPWKLASRVAYLWQFGIFLSEARTAQNDPRMKIHIGNVSQDTSVL